MIAVSEGPRLNIGSGPNNPPGWVNMDGSWQTLLACAPVLARLGSWVTGREMGHWPRGIVHCDVRRGLGYGPATVSVVYSSHIIEHLHRQEALAFLHEVFRVLKPGGVCRIVTPDLSAMVDRYLQHRAKPMKSKDKASSDLMMEMLILRPRDAPRQRNFLEWYRRRTDFHHHKWMYDADGLTCLLLEAGFTEPRTCAYLESAIPEAELAVVERRDRLENGNGVCVEARK